MCVRGFFNLLSYNLSDVVIDIKDLFDYVLLGILSVEDRGGVLEDIINEDLVINFNDVVIEELKDDRYMLFDGIYNNIEEKYYKFEK